MTTAEEFTDFATAASPRLRRTAFLLCGDWHTAEDLAQTTLAKVFVSWRRIRQRDAANAYAMRTLATNKAAKPIKVAKAVGDILMSPGGKTAYVQTADAVVPISTATNTAGKPITLLQSSKKNATFASVSTQMAITPNGRTLYVPIGSGNVVVPVLTATNEPAKAIKVGDQPGALVVAPNGRTLYVGSNSGTVTVISTATNKPAKTLEVGSFPARLAITPNGRTVYAAVDGRDAGTLVPIAAATDTAGPAIKVGPMPSLLAVTQDSHTLYEGSWESGTVTPISTVTSVAGAPISVGRNPQAQELEAIAIAP